MSRSIKRIILLGFDLVSIALSFVLSKLFLGVIIDMPNEQLKVGFVLVTIVYLALSIYLKVFSLITRYTDYESLFKIGLSVAMAYGFLLLSSFYLWQTFSYRFILTSSILTFVLMVVPRLTWRAIHDRKSKSKSNTRRPVRTLVVGAGDGGQLFINTVIERKLDFELVGIVDADPSKLNSYIRNVKVIGNRNDIPALVKDLEIEQVTIAIPSLPGKERESLVEICNSVNVKVNSMPSIEDIVAGNISVSSLKEIDIADLLGRPEVVLDQEKLRSYFKDKTVLVTGAGGSIGSELCRQVARFKPDRLILVGHGENSIYLIHQEMVSLYGAEVELIPVIADIQDRDLMFSVMKEFQPHVVYHAAAHKHVPLMEFNPHEAVKNNIFGTKNVAEAAKEAGVNKFVMVSTDKAVNPPNVMGATKRVAEMIVTGLNGDGKTQFVAVRFGNVLGSRGSVVPLFKEQIKKGGPVTVTDFRMTRYFMTIPEASRLVIQAGYMANGGEVFVLDMGEPVHILDLARKVIKLSGHTEEEIQIVETGIRPGEKLYEELLSTEERISEQVYEKIFVGRVTNQDKEKVQDFISRLLSLDKTELKKTLIDFARQD
ncbi:polysaccharide biosynthesis protein [Streptococcus suis]|uniref:polysaccharide biosynthesis protein n=1 Tax=Streptococcus suis TaxID=1307 RepID=UPI00211D18B8|nr:nucleoside-diphosphate sugar epimerase/dehydratase [Streptococcus suis]UUM58706.1 polysaccharide biosynthesis protein [Streptococcus suis]